MVYNTIESRFGLTPIANLDTSARQSPGTIVRAEDPTYGTGEFVYLAGAANTVVGSLVEWNPVANTTTLNPNTANLAGPVAVAMAACTASYFGWYQFEGAAVIKKAAIKFSPNVAVFQSSTAGRISSSAASGKEILGARSINTATIASATSTVVVLINRPHNQGQAI